MTTSKREGTAGEQELEGAEPSVEGSAESEAESPFHGVARHALIYGAGIVLGRAISFLMLPIYTRYLTDADYGVIGLIDMTLDFISIIAGGTLAAGVFRFYYQADSDREREEVVSTGFLLISTMYALVGTAVFLTAPHLSNLLFDSTDNTVLFQIAAVNLALGGLAIVPLAFARVRDRSTLFVATNLAKAVLAVGCNILFVVVLKMGVMGVMLGGFVASLAVGLFLTIWLVRSLDVVWSAAAAKNLLRFGLPLVATSVATFTVTFADRFFLQAAVDEGAVGRYNLGYQFGFILVVLGFTPVQLVWGPRRFQVATRADRDGILSRAFVLINVLLISVALAIALFVKDFLYIMASPEFHPAAQVVPIILVAYILQSWGSIQDIGILVSEKTRFITISDFIAAGIALAGYVVLIPRYLGMGAAYATLAAFVARYLLTYVFSQHFMPVRYNWRPVAVLASWAGGIALIGHILPPMSIPVSVGVRTGMGLAYLAGVWFLPILTEDDRRAGISIVGLLFQKMRFAKRGAPG